MGEKKKSGSSSSRSSSAWGWLIPAAGLLAFSTLLFGDLGDAREDGLPSLRWLRTLGFDWDYIGKPGNSYKIERDPAYKQRGYTRKEVESVFQDPNAEILFNRKVSYNSQAGTIIETRFSIEGFSFKQRSVFIIFVIRNHGKKKLIRPFSAFSKS